MRLYVSQLKDEIQMSKRKWKPPDIELVYSSWHYIIDVKQLILKKFLITFYSQSIFFFGNVTARVKRSKRLDQLMLR